MRFIRVTSAAGIFLLFGTMVPVYAQGDSRAISRAIPANRRKAGRSALSSLSSSGSNRSRQQQAPQRAQQPQQQQQQPQRAQQPQQRQQQPQRAQQPQQRQQQQPSALSSRSNGNSSPSALSRIDNRNSSAPRTRRERGSNRKAGYSTAAGRGTIPGSRIAPKLGLRPSNLGAARRLRRILHPSGQFRSLFRQPAFLPPPRAPGHLHGVSAFRPTAGFRSCCWIRGRNTGRRPGMTPMIFTSTTTMATTSYNRRYPQVRLAVTIAL